MKIYVWGIGGGGQIAERWNLLPMIEGFIISSKKDNVLQNYLGKPIYTPDEVIGREYDAIIIASVFVENIYSECKHYGFDMDKVIFVYRRGAAHDDNFNDELAEKVFGKEIAQVVKHSWHVIDTTSMYFYDDPAKYDYRRLGVFGSDYVRLRVFELLCREIKSREVEGSIAELGVFRGAFTYFLNRELAGRKCYLFDTFEGFDASEAKREVDRGILSTAEINSFQNTNIDIVMQQLEHKDCVEIRK